MNHHLCRLVLFCVFVPLHLSTGPLFAQSSSTRRDIAISVGMGVCYIKASGVVDYINQFNNKVPDITTAVEFFAAPEFHFRSDLGLKLEYAYLLKSYTIAGPLPGSFEFSYTVHMPTTVLFYVLQGDGYYVKLGGGVGYHFGKFTRFDPNSESESQFTSNGLGFKLEVIGNTAFGESLYGLIGGDLRLDFIGSLKDAGGQGLEIQRAFGTIDPLRLHFMSAGIKFGLIYYF